MITVLMAPHSLTFGHHPGNLSIIAHIIDQSVRNCSKLMVSIIDLTRLLSLLTRQIKQQSALNHKL